MAKKWSAPNQFHLSKVLVQQLSSISHSIFKCTALIIVETIFVQFYGILIAFYSHFADAPPDEPLGETDCCGFNVLTSIL